MNLDIRNIDEQFKEAIEHIKQTNPLINTNTKAVRHATVIFKYKENEIVGLNNKIKALENTIYENERTNQEIKEYFKLHKKLNKIFT